MPFEPMRKRCNNLAEVPILSKFCSLLSALAMSFGLVAPAAAAIQGGYCPTQSVTIAVVGDSLADGLWGALYRNLLGCETVAILRVTYVSDGLTKTAPDKWIERLNEELGETEAADMVLVQIGANDIQPIRNGSGRSVFGDDDWNTAYAERSSALARELGRSAQKVIWVGLPIVGDEDLETDYRHVTSLQEGGVTAAAEEGSAVSFVDIHDATMFGSGAFTQNAEVGGDLRQLRAGDQIHFTELGYDLVLGTVWPEVETLLHAKDTNASLDAIALQ